MNSKQLFLTTALITLLSSAAIAEVSISGEAKVNAKGRYYSMETDLTITGKSGDTSVTAQISLDDNDYPEDNRIEQLYMTSKVAGIDIKVGCWKEQGTELGDSRYLCHITPGYQVFRISTVLNDLTFAYQKKMNHEASYVSVSGIVNGINFEHKIGDNDHTPSNSESDNETTINTSIKGFDFDIHNRSFEDGSSNTAVKVSKKIKGFDLIYVDVNGTGLNPIEMDGYIGKSMGLTSATAFGISTNILGNKITYKDISMDDEDAKELILTRNIASGATFEATYRDVNLERLYSGFKGLDLELAVKF